MTKIYGVWKDMRRRCENPNRDDYSRYGGKGIKVCDEWVNSFRAFWEWSMTHGYQEGLQIDRIENDGDYSPTNCRFVTNLENCRNRPQFKRTDVTIESVTEILKTTSNLSEASRLSGLSRTLIRRVARERGMYDSISKLGKARYNLGRK